MKKHILFLLCLIAVASTRAQVFADHFADKTLRVDYIFNGNASGQAICLDGLSALPTWAGRKHHLAELPLQGNGQIVMRNAASGKIRLPSNRTTPPTDAHPVARSSDRISGIPAIWPLRYSPLWKDPNDLLPFLS